MSVTEKGEHEQRVWLTDAQIDLLIKMVRAYRIALAYKPHLASGHDLEKLQKLLENERP